MKCSKLITLLVFFGFTLYISAQTATLTGIVLNHSNDPLKEVNITTGSTGTFSDNDGFYSLQVPADKPISVTFSHLGHKNVILENLILNTNEVFEFNPVLSTDAIQIAGVTITPTGNKTVTGITTVSPEIVRNIPGANAGVENILKLLPGVSSSNELSTQYNVRGGNYDENLVYVNEIEVYRPFLVRSAQQEGMSFVNSDMVQNVRFSSGGFQAKYGDKLSSVLDISYKKPSKTSVQLDLSFLGASATVETISKNKKLSTISGIRYRDNGLLVNSQETNTNFNPTFADAQTFTTYRFSKKFHLDFLGNISINDYQNEPLNRQTNFGTITEPKSLVVYYQGEENNKYNTVLGALKGNYFLNENTTLKLIASLYHTTEEEYSDVIAQYVLGSVDNDLSSDSFGSATNLRGIGTQLNRARNELDALIFNLSHKGNHTIKNKVLEWGVKYTHEDIRDQLRESEFIDSVGFFVRPPLPEFNNNQPEEPFESPLVAYDGVNAKNFVKTDRFSGFVQFSNRLNIASHDVYYNLGIRAQHWSVSGENIKTTSQTVISPRGQVSLKPNWKRDMLFRLSGGLYHQPPFYRELRDQTGTINPDVKAQESIHLVLGNEYSFNLWERPFTLMSELYYKKLNHVNTYTLEDVRIRYVANNNAQAYAYGADFRLNGAFVPGTESWVSIGFLKTEENSNNRGYTARPSDQRLKFGILYQDYIPEFPNFKMYLNLVYNTGVPGGSPNYTDPYIYNSRLRDYKRADLGISYIFVDGNRTYQKNHWLHRFKELSAGFEIFNLFNNQNSITNTWVRDVDSKQQFAVPNFMTSRVLNLRLRMRF
ncbi:TonB-dependent receptor [Zobellia amurskyensis]|uniref:TonB-dependent receptor n=1 Tax=Zobellia amurskyensis TaxID=248905 RepID=A0A7X2ZTU0_9FLAO|nr:TonB-dependent receptor plug domain-containing protein [Zobellia amurskyensis]MUH36285.1 TonB-dependent receptor [Zobellia amurskyensis]